MNDPDLYDIAIELGNAIAAYGPTRSSFEDEHIERLEAIKAKLVELARAT